METYMTSGEVAEILNVSRPKASRTMVSAGAVNIGTGKYMQLRITQTALMAYLETKKTEEPEPIRYTPPKVVKTRNGKKLSDAEMYPGLQRKRYDHVAQAR